MRLGKSPKSSWDGWRNKGSEVREGVVRDGLWPVRVAEMVNRCSTNARHRLGVTMETTRALMPRVRQDELIVEDLQDETLVYDLERHKASCLNGTAALV